MKNEEVILGALGKLIRENPIVGVDQATNSSFSLVTRSGKAFVVDLSSLDSNSDIDELRKLNSSIEMAFSILNNRVADILSTHDDINENIQQLKDIDVESITKSLVEELLNAYDIDNQIKDEVTRQVKLMGDGVSEAVAQSVIDGLSEVVKADFEELAKALDTTNESISSMVDKKTMRSAVSKAVAGLKDVIDSLPILSEERVQELIEASGSDVEIPISVVGFEVKNGHTMALFSDGTEKDIGLHVKDRVYGVQGDKGDNGLSAYQIAVKNGFVGTEQEWLDSLGGGSGDCDCTFDGDREITRDGLPQITPGGTTIKEVLENLLYPAVDLALSFSGLGGPYEKGLARNINLNASVTPNDGIVSLRQFKQGGTVLSTEPTDSMSETVSGVKTTTTYTAYVEYELSGQQQNKSVNRTATFYAPSYYGVGAVGNENEAWIKSNLTKDIRSNRNLNTTFSPTLERYYFAYPQSYGAVVKVFDQNNFDVTDTFTQFTQTFTLADGSTEDYYIYRSNDDTTQTNFTLRFT